MNRDNRAPPRGSPQQQALTEALTGAVERIQTGRLDEAVKVLESKGGLALKNPVGRNILGDIRLKQGNLREALRAFDAALKLAPTFPEAHANRGVALQELGRQEEALAAEDRALRYRPDYATAHFNRGNILRQLGRLDDALGAYDRALRSRPGFAEARINRGSVLTEKRRPLEALAEFRKAMALQSDQIGAHLGSATAHEMLGQHKEALTAIDIGLRIAPGDVEALLLKGGVLLRADRFEEALEIADRLIDEKPDNSTAHAVRSSALCKLKRFEEALAEADEAIRLAPKEAEGYAVRAMALSELDRVEEQMETLKTAERLGATSHTFYHARAIAFCDLGDLNEAADSYERAIELAPDMPKIHYHYSMLLLSRGDFDRGWAEHEWRTKDREFLENPVLGVAPPWRGEDLAGKKVLVFAEQGHGDSIQFARFLTRLVALDVKVSLIMPAPLIDLFKRAYPMIDIGERAGLRRGFDCQIPLMSLPYALGADLEAVSADVPYLLADAARIEKWRGRLGNEGFRIGVAWQGNPKYHRDRFRSIPLAEFAPLAAIPGVRLISIQAVNGLDQLRALPDGMKVERFGAEIENNPDGFNEVAGLMANFDLLITSDTGTAHLAGALGRPIWVALRHRPDWRWMHERTDSLWYPTMRLFRQTRHDDWPTVFATMAEALADLAGKAR